MAAIILFFLFSIALLAYGYLLFSAQKDITGLKPNSDKTVHQTKNVTVLIAARNEEKVIHQCITSILTNKNKVPDFDILIVNDHSTDKTVEMVNSFQNVSIRCVDLPEGFFGKKQALEYGIHFITDGIIVSTDADCIVQPDWLLCIVQAYEKDPHTVMTTGIVLPSPTGTNLQKFQWLDFVATMALTSYGISKNLFYVSNGANMSFLKKAFLDVDGYKDNHHIASGDDVFLSKKLADQADSKIQFIKNKEAVVYTQPENSWKALWNQRKRWATKSKSYASSPLILIQGFVFFMALSIVILLCLGIFYHPIFLIPAGFVFIVKYSIDYLFLQKLSVHFDQKEVMTNFTTSFILYQMYIITAGLLALIPTKTKWKGRKV